jgi:hypothetical protein
MQGTLTMHNMKILHLCHSFHNFLNAYLATGGSTGPTSGDGLKASEDDPLTCARTEQGVLVTMPDEEVAVAIEVRPDTQLQGSLTRSLRRTRRALDTLSVQAVTASV